MKYAVTKNGRKIATVSVKEDAYDIVSKRCGVSKYSVRKKMPKGYRIKKIDKDDLSAEPSGNYLDRKIKEFWG